MLQHSFWYKVGKKSTFALYIFYTKILHGRCSQYPRSSEVLPAVNFLSQCECHLDLFLLSPFVGAAEKSFHDRSYCDQIHKWKASGGNEKIAFLRVHIHVLLVDYQRSCPYKRKMK